MTCYFDDNILSPTSHTTQEFMTLFEEQEVKLQQEIKVHRQYKMNPPRTLDQINRQYGDLFFYE